MVSPLLKHCKSSTGVSVEIPYLAITKHFLRPEMLDLTRFPVSDEFFPDRKTFCTILDRKVFFDFLNYWFSTKGHVTTKHMELWGIRCRIQWEHSQVPVGPPSCPKVLLTVRNRRLRHEITFSEKFRGIMKIRIRKILVTNLEHVCPGLPAPI